MALQYDANGIGLFSSAPGVNRMVGPSFRRISEYWGPMVNVLSHGAVPGGSASGNRAAFQAALDAMHDLVGAALLIPPGTYDVDDTLVAEDIAGLKIVGSGSGPDLNATGWNSMLVGTRLRGTGLAGKPLLKLSSCHNYSISDLTIAGNTSASLTGAAEYGVQTVGRAGFPSGVGLVTNVSFQYCQQGWRAGTGSAAINDADVTFNRCEWVGCGVAIYTNHAQAVNYGLVHCTAVQCDDFLSLFGGNVHASMLATYDTERVVVSRGGGGPNAGFVTVVNGKFDGGSVRPQIYVAEAAASQLPLGATFIDPTFNLGQMSISGSARVVLRAQHRCIVRGGRNLCNANGVLVDLLDDIGGATPKGSQFLVEMAELPDDPAQVIGTVAATRNKYRVRDCFTHEHISIADYDNLP